MIRTNTLSAWALAASLMAATVSPNGAFAAPAGPAGYPKFRSTVPLAFQGRWDELVSDKCWGREARFEIGARNFANFEVQYDVTRVKLLSPSEIEISTTFKDEQGGQEDSAWQFRLADGGRAITDWKKGGLYFRKCPG